MLHLHIIGMLFALAFALHMLWDEAKRLLQTVSDMRALSEFSAPIRRLLWHHWIWPALPVLSIAAVLIWLLVAFAMICRLAQTIMAPA